MNWKNIDNGYEFQVFFSQGQHSSKTMIKVNCALDKLEFSKIKEILSHLADGIDKHSEEYTEKVAEYIMNQTNYQEQEIMQIIGNLVLSDIAWEDQMARVSHIDVYRYEDGKVQKSYV